MYCLADGIRIWMVRFSLHVIYMYFQFSHHGFMQLNGKQLSSQEYNRSRKFVFVFPEVQ